MAKKKAAKTGAKKRYATGFNVAKGPNVTKNKSDVQPGKPAKKDINTGLIVKVLEGNQLTLTAVTTLVQLQRAGFLDAWRQYVETLANNDKVASAETYAKIFSNTVKVLGLTVEDLLNEVGGSLEDPAVTEPVASEIVPEKDALDVI